MAGCPKCGRRPWLRAFASSGLCRPCDAAYQPWRAEQLALIERAIAAHEKGDSPRAVRESALAVVRALERLEDYEKIGVPTVTPRPSEELPRWRFAVDGAAIRGEVDAEWNAWHLRFNRENVSDLSERGWKHLMWKKTAGASCCAKCDARDGQVFTIAAARSLLTGPYCDTEVSGSGRCQCGFVGHRHENDA